MRSGGVSGWRQPYEAQRAAARALALRAVLEVLHRRGLDNHRLRPQERAYLDAYAAAHHPATPDSLHLLYGARHALRLFYMFHDVHGLGEPDGPNSLTQSEHCAFDCCSLWASRKRLILSGQVVGRQPESVEDDGRPHHG